MPRAGRLTDDRLTCIEQGARARHTLKDRVVVELIEEIRRLRACMDNQENRDGSDHDLR